MRLFISFNFSEPDSGRIARYAAALRDVAAGGSYTPPENYHVTLAFLGECERSRAAAVRDAIREATQGVAPFDVRLGRLDCFRRPEGDIAFVSVDGGETLGRLHTGLYAALEKRGFVLPDDEKRRDFRPHITIAREMRLPEEDLKKLPADAFSHRVSRVSLMLSARVHGRPHYSELEGITLG